MPPQAPQAQTPPRRNLRAPATLAAAGLLVATAVAAVATLIAAGDPTNPVPPDPKELVQPRRGGPPGASTSGEAEVRQVAARPSRSGEPASASAATSVEPTSQPAAPGAAQPPAPATSSRPAPSTPAPTVAPTTAPTTAPHPSTSSNPPTSGSLPTTATSSSPPTTTG